MKVLNSYKNGLFLEDNQLYQLALLVVHFFKVLPLSTTPFFHGLGKYTFKVVLFCKDSKTTQKVPRLSDILVCHKSLFGISFSRSKARQNECLHSKHHLFTVAARKTN